MYVSVISNCAASRTGVASTSNSQKARLCGMYTPKGSSYLNGFDMRRAAFVQLYRSST